MSPLEPPSDHPASISAATDCWFLAGATASGKTTIGLELAQLLNAEIVSLDSMAIYRGMDIGTAKPTKAQRRVIDHHLLDIVEPNQDYSLSQYVSDAQEKIRQIRERGHEVLFVGGTPLYLKSMLRGLFEGPPADWEFRREVEEEIEQRGLEILHQRLQQVDPLSADKLHPNDKRRIIRALEVYKLTGQPISHLQTQFEESYDAEDCKVFVLQWPRTELHQRTDARVEQMFADGLVEEVQRLLAQYGQLSRTASQAVGYRETIEHLQGERDLDETIQLVKNRTHRFVRHQETWFRSLEECRFVPQTGEKSPLEVAQEILTLQRSTDP